MEALLPLSFWRKPLLLIMIIQWRIMWKKKLRRRNSTAELVNLLEGKSADEAQPPIEGFVWTKPGTFSMGSPDAEPGREDDETLHQVWLTRGFYLAKHEVTQAEYKKVMGVNPSHVKSQPFNSRAQHPVEMVA